MSAGDWASAEEGWTLTTSPPPNRRRRSKPAGHEESRKPIQAARRSARTDYRVGVQPERTLHPIGLHFFLFLRGLTTCIHSSHCMPVSHFQRPPSSSSAHTTVCVPRTTGAI